MLSSDAAPCGGARRSARNAAAEYICVRGLRYAAPYLDVAVHWSKERHEGKTLAAACTNMFGNHSSDDTSDPSYWCREIEAGRVMLKRHRAHKDDPEPDFELVSPEALVSRQCQIKILRHVHERVTSAADPVVLYEDNSMLVVNKPAGVPVLDEVDGSSSVVCITRRLRPDLTSLRLAHRLDLSVSGALVLAKGGGAASRLMKEFEERRVRKVYIARVKGRLQTDDVLVVDACQMFTRGRATVVAADADGAKPCRTDFLHVASCGDGTSIVECRLHTGRQHQIRCHLAHIGHPIANDALYGGDPPADDGPRIYEDEALEGCTEADTSDSDRPAPGRLHAMLERTAVPWCAKCAWCLAATRGALLAPLAPTQIYLHARLCEFLPDGPRVEAPLPPWAEGTAAPRCWAETRLDSCP